MKSILLGILFLVLVGCQTKQAEPQIIRQWCYPNTEALQQEFYEKQDAWEAEREFLLEEIQALREDKKDLRILLKLDSTHLEPKTESPTTQGH